MLINGVQTGGAAVAGAISDAANATGTSFRYLLATAQAESGLNAHAAAGTSSARGLFQFIDRTWLATLKQAGPSLGYGRYADAITQTADGDYQVSDPAMRQQILALRDDPAANAAMAGAFTRDNAAKLTQMLGRQPSESELYMAHFLGANGAGRLISLAANSPATPAASIFPGAAEANRSIFYDRAGNARSVADVYATLSNRYEAAQAGSVGTLAALQGVETLPAVSPGGATGALPVIGPASLFTDLPIASSRDGVSPIVRELWSTRPQVAAALTGVPAPTAAATLDARPAAAPPPTTTIDGLRSLFRDLTPNVRKLFTSRT